MTASDKIEIFPWNPNFETGIDAIDEQHKHLVVLLNDFAVTLTQDDAVEIEKAFEELAKYADFHFKFEEAIWQKNIKEPSLVARHEKSHTSFLPKVEELRNQPSKDPQEVLEDIIVFLINWLSSHIIREDKELALIIQHLKEGMALEKSKEVTHDIMSSSMKELIHTVLAMYDNLSIRTIKLIREQRRRRRAEVKLSQAYQELERLAITDSLTNAYNRRHFETCFQLEFNRCKRNKTFLNVILIDIDDFKLINDTYGHHVGDQALIHVVECLKGIFKRDNDLIFRFGGEEFVVLVENEDSASTVSLAQTIRQSVLDLKIPNEKSASKVLSVSQGVVSTIPCIEDSYDSIMQLVDQRLYEAKKSGKNIVVYE